MSAIVQRTPEWYAARCGSLGASQIHEAIARTKTGYGASRANLMTALLLERLTGQPTEGYVNAAMQHGIDTEPQARAAYSFYRDIDVAEVGLVRHPSIAMTHASPDGLVGDDGMVELKCPSSTTHLDTLLAGSIPQKYTDQMQWQMACTGRAWCDFASFDPRLPESMRLWVRRVPRDPERIAELEAEVTKFLAELDQKLAALRATYEPTKEAA